MSHSLIGRANVGRIAERIVANELDALGFTVRDLNMEGISANADLLAIREQAIWQIQVKGSTYDQTYPNNGWWFQYGYCNEEHIHNPNEKMFNRAKGPFHADVVALVCVRSASEYQLILVPENIAEDAAKINLSYAYRTKKKDGTEKKPSKVWFTQFISERAERAKEQHEEWGLLQPFLIDRSRNTFQAKDKMEVEEIQRREAETLAALIDITFKPVTHSAFSSERAD